MNPYRVVFSLAVLSGLALSMAHAQATRTWVSGVGDDANPCSRTAPCKTWAGAISKTVAGGEIDALDPGGFGALTITKAITLDGGGGQVASVLVAGTNGITVAAGTADMVILRNLRIDGLGPGANGGLIGISFISGAELHIDHCFIFNFNDDGISIGGSTGSQAIITDTVSEGNGKNGVEVEATTHPMAVTISNSHFLHNEGSGVLAGSLSQVAVRASEASGNAKSGFDAAATTGVSELFVTDSTAANNGVSGVAAGGGTVASVVRINNVSIFGNTAGLTTGTDGKIESYGNNANANSGTPTAKLALQ